MGHVSTPETPTHIGPPTAISPSDPDRRHLNHPSDRRVADRPRARAKTPERRKRDRRATRFGAGLLAAAMAFGAGARIQLQRRELPESERQTRVPLPERTSELLFGKEEPTAGGLDIAEDDAAIAAYVERFSNGAQRAGFTAALERGGRYLPTIKAVFAEEGLPEELAYVALVESEFKPLAVSGARAAGMWQFMPRTGKHLGLAQDSFVDERSDVEEATRAAAQYLKMLHGRFHSWPMALAAYNAGEGTVSRAVKKHGTDDFWKLSKTRAFSRETREYVPKIYAAIVMARNPARYGLDLKPQAPPETMTIKVADAVDLRVVAEVTGTDVETIRDLNPELRRIVTPVDRTFELTVPASTSEVAQAKLQDLPSSQQVRTHVMKRGQTLSTVAKRYGTSVTEISKVNAIGRKARLKSGTELLIPPASLKAD